jgi:hypothetical protein
MKMVPKLRSLLLAGAVVSAGTIGLLGVSASAASAASSSNPSYTCTNDTYFDFDTGTIVTNPNGGVSHGGCVSTDAKYGYADLSNEPVLSNAALISNCKLIAQSFQDMAQSIPLPTTIGTRTFTDSSALGTYVFKDIFGPNPSTCAAILAADHATIASPGPEGPYDVYYTGGAGQNTTYAPGVPADLAFLFGGES